MLHENGAQPGWTRITVDVKWAVESGVSQGRGRGNGLPEVLEGIQLSALVV